jgi:hypothetical protein
MGRLYVASVLSAISRRQPATVADVELKPITPGAWAAWARVDSQLPVPAAEPQIAPVPVATTLKPVAGRA